MFKFDLHHNENLVEMFRKSEMVLAKPVLAIFVFIYIPWYFLIKYELVADYKNILLAWTTLVLIFGIHRYLLWLLNVCLLTSQRFVMVEYKSLFKKKVVEIHLDKISNISYSTSGIFSSLFGFGDLHVQFSGSSEMIIAKNISQPSKVKDKIWKAAKAATHKSVHSVVAME